MQKVVVDTSVLLEDIGVIYQFDGVIIPLSVIEELDSLKIKDGELGERAREAVREIESVLSKDSNVVILKDDTSIEKVDDRIVKLARDLVDSHDACFLPLKILTNDLIVKIKAKEKEIEAESYYGGSEVAHIGYREIYIPKEKIDSLCKDKYLYFDIGDPIHVNEYVNFLTYEGNSALAKYIGNHTYVILSDKLSAWGQKGKNKEQRYAFDALLDDNIPLVALEGKAGSGKTYATLAVALEKVREKQKYNQIIVTRALEYAGGNTLGFLPGDMGEKMNPWMAGIYDNLDQLLGDRDTVDLFIDDGTIQLFSLEYMRGRSLVDKFIIVEESQNLKKEDVKLLVTRMGKNTKMVFLGDPEQRDNKRVSRSSNGLSYLIKRFHSKDECHKYFAHIALVNGKLRSEIAHIGAEIL